MDSYILNRLISIKTVLVLIIYTVLPLSTSSQEAAKINRVEKNSIGKIISVPAGNINKLGNITGGYYYRNCAEILQNNPGASDGVYTIDPDGEGPVEEFDCYCDMTTDGGGWTLVLLSNSSVTGCPRPYWDEAVNEINLNGTFSDDITSFDLLMAVAQWNTMGDEARLDMGSSPSSLNHRAFYDFSLDETNNYALQMSNEIILIGTTSPGMYSYHNGRPLSTRDADHDDYSSNCSTMFYETAWWYVACFKGSFWGGGLEAYQDAPSWDDNSNFYNYGSIWLR